MNEYHIVDDFFHRAEEMRSAYSDHFARPHDQRPETHQIWNYWYVPGLYTYLRTRPEKIFPDECVRQFVEAVRSWSGRHLGCDAVSEPTLSVYVNGCMQGLHNDSENGRWAYVFSLTRWDERAFSGGETLLLRTHQYWNSPSRQQAGAGSKFYDLVEPRFNRLVIFDDRLIHAVARIEGNMDPRACRVVLHGHIRERGVLLDGALQAGEVRPVLDGAWHELAARIRRAQSACGGVLVVRLTIEPEGRVSNVVPLTDHLWSNTEGPSAVASVRDEIIGVMQRLSFPTKSGGSALTVPVRITSEGNPGG